MVRTGPPADRYTAHPLTGMRPARYRAIPSKSAVSSRLRDKEEEGEEEEGEKFLAHATLPWLPRMVRHLRAIPSPCAGRRNEVTSPRR
ncbi:hypothetical protein BHE74_00048380, partial [Ensete ventricosum]